MYKLGKFEVTSGKLRVSDPCYPKDTWCAGVLENVKKGTWTAFTKLLGIVEPSSTNLDPDYASHIRNAELIIFCEDNRRDILYDFRSKREPLREEQKLLMESIPELKDIWLPQYVWEPSSIHVGVDSGQAGFFDEDLYPDHNNEPHISRTLTEKNPWADRNKLHDEFYEKVGKLTLGEEFGDESTLGGCIDNFGAVSHTGWGDGGYECQVIKDKDSGEIIAAKIIYIDENYKEEEEDLEEEEVIA